MQKTLGIIKPVYTWIHTTHTKLITKWRTDWKRFDVDNYNLISGLWRPISCIFNDPDQFHSMVPNCNTKFNVPNVKLWNFSAWLNSSIREASLFATLYIYRMFTRAMLLCQFQHQLRIRGSDWTRWGVARVESDYADNCGHRIVQGRVQDAQKTG